MRHAAVEKRRKTMGHVYHNHTNEIGVAVAVAGFLAVALTFLALLAL